DLASLLNHLKGTQLLPQPEPGVVASERSGGDLKQVKGQETAKRALEIAAAGAHNLLFSGPPGTGKTLLASRLPGLLPPLDEQE
ncbi:MAG TPA: AAA family ATPase, partial [Erythrobacter sp.]|nr:AAA family ATPase [Erythrobacter sp.]